MIVVLFVLSGLLRLSDPAHPGILAFILALVGVLLATVTGWMGGELAERLGLDVDGDANLDAPGFLGGRGATGGESG